MAIEDLWYKNAVLYCLDVEKYMDADADGIGDFEGLNRRLEYLHGLGVTCLWLQLHNFSNRAKTVVVEPKVKGGNLLTDVFDENHSRTENGMHQIKMPAYGHRWMRVGAIDNALNRMPF